MMKQSGIFIFIIILYSAKLFSAHSYETSYEEYSGIYSQDKKVGYSKTVYDRSGDDLKITNNTVLELLILGGENRMNIFTEYILKDDKIYGFEFIMESSDLSVKSVGQRHGNEFRITNSTISGESRFSLSIEKEPVAAPYVNRWIAKKGLKAGDVHSFVLFEPSVLLLGSGFSNQQTIVKILGRETITLHGKEYNTYKLSIKGNGSESTSWITEEGESVKDISSIGLTALKEKENESGNIINSRVDITEQTAISSDETIKNPRKLRRLKLRLSGLDSLDDFDINYNDRQSLEGDVLSVNMETINISDYGQNNMIQAHTGYLENTNLIQSNSPEIKRIARLLTDNEESILGKIESIKTWVYKSLEKKPTISIPNALDILKTRKGDCNEHAVLFTALARSSGIPTKIALGIVYINQKFYYHAWNEVFAGRWYTVDSTFNQFPADASHVKFLEGDLNRSPDIIRLVGKLRIEILEAS